MSFADRLRLLACNVWFWICLINLWFASDIMFPGLVVVGALVVELFSRSHY